MRSLSGVYYCPIKRKIFRVYHRYPNQIIIEDGTKGYGAYKTHFQYLEYFLFQKLVYIRGFS